MELNSSNPSQILFWNHVEYIGIPFISALWLTTALMYTGHFLRYRGMLLTAIYAVPLITMILRLTNDYHYLYFASITYTNAYGTTLLAKTMGPWAYVQMIHAMLMLLLAMGFFIYDSTKSEERQRGKVLFVIVATLFGVAGLLLSVIKPFGLLIDYMALCLPITSIAVIVAIARYDLLETRSIARSRAFETNDDALLLVNRNGKILDYNSSAKNVFDQIHIPLNNAHLSKLLDSSPDLLKALNGTETAIVELNMDSEQCYYEVTTKAIDNRKVPRGWIKELHDITPIYRLNKRLREQAMTDELSTLGNRRAFMTTGREWVARSDAKGSSLHLLMLDLDHFKNINDCYGHPAGDIVIRSFSQILRGHFGAHDLVARLGGEEFAVLHTDSDETDIHQLVDALLLSTAQRTYHYQDAQFHVTVSIGMTQKQPDQTLEDMMRQADKALYESKRQGRNRFVTL